MLETDSDPAQVVLVTLTPVRSDLGQWRSYQQSKLATQECLIGAVKKSEIKLQLSIVCHLHVTL